jgi:hypothetical protein
MPTIVRFVNLHLKDNIRRNSPNELAQTKIHTNYNEHFYETQLIHTVSLGRLTESYKKLLFCMPGPG